MREEKQFLLDEIKEKIEDSKGFIALRYKEFTSSMAREFRNSMADVGAEFEVVRKRVFIKAINAADIQFDEKVLEGHVGILFSEEEEASKVAKSVVKYGEANNGAVAVLGGHLEGAFCSAEDIKAIATLPSLPEMRAQLLGLFEAPMAQTAQVVQAILTSLLYCLEEKSKKD